MTPPVNRLVRKPIFGGWPDNPVWIFFATPTTSPQALNPALNQSSPVPKAIL
jgi:hypothetical protein